MALSYQPEESNQVDYPTGGGGGGGPLPSSVQPRSTVISAIEDFDAVLTRLAGYVEALENIEDFINGPRPRPTRTPNAEDKVIADSLINKMQQRRRQFVRLVDDVERSIKNINEGLRPA